MRSLPFLISLAAIGLMGCAKRPAPEARESSPVVKISPKTQPPVAAPVVAEKKGDDDPLRLPPDVLARCKAAAVLIGNFEDGKLNSTGSGVVLSDGKTVVTNRHVVVGDDEKPDPLKLVFFAGTDKARIVQVKPEAIALLASKPLTAKDYDEDDVASIRLPVQIAAPLDVAKDSSIEETASAWGVGFPNGMEIRRSDGEIPGPTIHTMRIERVERKKDEVSVLQFAGSVTYGDSGGPVVTRSGEVLGLMQALADGRSSIFYALPAWMIRAMIARQKTPGPKSGTLASRFTADLGSDPEVKPKAETAPGPKRRSDPGPIEGATSSLADEDVDEATMEQLSPMALTLLRNEPFARRGYIFKRAAIRRAFAATEWYIPRTRDMAAVERRFTTRERRNVDRIAAYQKAAGKQW